MCGATDAEGDSRASPGPAELSALVERAGQRAESALPRGFHAGRACGTIALPGLNKNAPRGEGLQTILPYLTRRIAVGLWRKVI